MNEEAAFGTLLRHFRTAAALSQEALAQRARMSAEAISALERGARSSPYRETVSMLANALSLTAPDRARLEAAARQRRHRLASPVRPHYTTVHNLPASIASLIGRSGVVSDVRELLTAHRLVTLVGTGGVGKTRIAVGVGERSLDGGFQGVWLVELAPVRDAAMVVAVTARTLGVSASLQRSLLESIVGALRRDRALIVLDNCEHVLTGARDMATAILRACPNVRILATSREPLNPPGERVYRVPSLGYPFEKATIPEIAQAPAVKLFVERARAVDHRFRLSDENASAIAEVCRRLDGIPLAIELAAARITTLSPRRLAQQLDERFRVLGGGDRTAPARLQTMRAAIGWSVDLLTDAEQAVMRRLAILAGGWSLDAAVAFCSDERVGRDRVLDLLTSLADKSLVTVQPNAAATRYAFLESIRAYALEQLAAAGEEQVIARRHCAWAADYGEWLARADFYADEIWWRNEWPGSPGGYEAPNRSEALRWALGVGADALLAARIAGSHHWETGHAEGRRLVDATRLLVEHLGARDLEARLWLSLSGFAHGEKCLEAARTSVALFEEIGDRGHWLGDGLAAVQEAALDAGLPEEALAVSDRLLALLEELRATRSVFHGVALRLRAHVLRALGRYDECRACIVEAMSLSDSVTQRILATVALAELESDMGNPDRAVAIVDDGARVVARNDWDHLLSGDRAGLARNRCNAAAYRLMLADVPKARIAALEALQLSRRGNSTPTILLRTLSLQHLATVAAMVGEIDRAARLKGYVDAWFSREGELRYSTAQRAYAVLVESLKAGSGLDEIDRFAAEGAVLDVDGALDLALATGSALAARA